MEDRKGQLHELYGIHFPDDMFEFWEWYHAQPPEIQNVFTYTLGFSLVGAFDVLAGRFDDVEPRYPAVMHWRFVQDPPEFITVISGNEDGLHWGYWFDDPDRLPPVVVSYFAHDAFDLQILGRTLFDALHTRITRLEEWINESMEDEPEEAEAYAEELEDLAMLRAALPPRSEWQKRVPTHETQEGMGIVAEGSPELIEQFLRAKEMWFEWDLASAYPLLESVYTELGREPLAAITRVIRETPYLPRIDVLEYKAGDYHSIETALAEPEKVKKLDMTKRELTELPDLSSLVNLEEIFMGDNALQTLPASLAGCTNLRVVNLYQNAFAFLPEVLFALPRLERVYLNANNLSSLDLFPSVPESLKELSLNGNPLSEDEIARFNSTFPSVSLSF